MVTITGLNISKKDKNKTNIYLNGKFHCSLFTETVVKNNLKVGTCIDKSKLDNIQLESEKNFAFNKVLKLISVRYKTRKEIETYLFSKGYVSSVVYYCISKLEEYHFLDDRRYAESYVNSHKSSKGPLKLKQELMAKGIKEDLCESAIENLSQEEEILRLATKYMKNKEDTKENYSKLIRYLIGKGFIFSEIKDVLKSSLEMEEE